MVTFIVDVLEIAVAAAVVALVGLSVALWKWRPHLSLKQSVSSRWLNDETLCITVAVRCVNASSYRNITLPGMAVAIHRLAPLSREEAESEDLPFVLQRTREWDKLNAPNLDPGNQRRKFSTSWCQRIKPVASRPSLFKPPSPKKKAQSGGGQQ